MASDSITVRCFDAGSSHCRDGTLSVRAPKHLLLVVADEQTVIDLAQVTFSERLGNLPRQMRLADGRTLEIEDNAALNQLLHQAGDATATTTGLVHWLEKHWMSACVSLCVALLCVYASITYGIPVAAKWVAFSLPASVDEQISEEIVSLFDEYWFTPSKLSETEQATLQARFQSLVTAAHLQTGHTPHLLFRASEKIGANAFALPSGTIILLDDLVTIADNHDQLAAVMAHEIGHVYHRHGLRSVLQASFIGLGLVFIDAASATSLAASLPVLLLQSGYSRDFERQADTFALQLMQRTGIPLPEFAKLMRKISPPDNDASLVNLISSHPPTAERIKQFE